MRFYSIILTLLLPIHLWSAKVHLNWNDQPTEIQLSETESKFIWTFESAKIDAATQLPIFIRQFEGEFNTQISNIQYDTLDLSDQKFVETSALTDQFKFREYHSVSRGINYTEASLTPYRINPQSGMIERVVSFQLWALPASKGVKSLKSKQLLKSASNNSVLSNGNWYKIRINKHGVYRLTFDEIKDLGFANPDNVGVWGDVGGLLPFINNGNDPTDLEQIPILKEKGSDNIFNSGDFILFYAKDADRWVYDDLLNDFKYHGHVYSHDAYLFLGDVAEPKEIDHLTEINDAITDTLLTFTDYKYFEEDTYNLIHSGRNWLGQLYDFDLSSSHLFTFENRDDNVPFDVTIQAASRNPNGSSKTWFDYTFNNNLEATKFFNNVNTSSVTSSFMDIQSYQDTLPLSGEQLRINIKYNKTTSTSKGWLDFIKVKADRALKMVGNQMHIRFTYDLDSNHTGLFNISSSNNINLWDITDLHNVKNVSLSNNGNIYDFKQNLGSNKQYIAFRNNGYLSPITSGDNTGKINNQNLHGIAPPDYIIVTHSKFTEQAERLAQFHRNDQDLDVMVIDQELIFNEFSSGARDASAIRNFMKHVYENAVDDNFKYLLLMGDGTYDNKNMDEDNDNFILTYQSENSESPVISFVSDDYYGLLDDREDIFTGLMDIGIGRFPVKTANEAKIMVDKIIEYHKQSSLGNWRNKICFIGDDEDTNLHMSQANTLSDRFTEEFPQMNSQKILLDAYEQVSSSLGARYPEATKNVTQQVEDGVLIINYTGHGGEYGLAHERLITNEEIVGWSNMENMPVFVTATCEFSRFDHVEMEGGRYTEFVSAGERLVLNNKGGAVSSLTTTRVVYASANFTLSISFYDVVFDIDPKTNERYRLGDIIRMTKVKSGTGVNKRNFVLLGDPALRLAAPVNKLVVDSINGVSAEVFNDTVGALAEVEIKGYITDVQDQMLSDFNGTLYATIYDKPQKITTLGNYGEHSGGRDQTPFTFESQTNILFKGLASIENGMFNFKFIIPKDIVYTEGNLKISLYAENGLEDASGYNFSIPVEGVEDIEISDFTGPEISLFMNDTTFIDGGQTDQNPVLLAKLKDLFGINTSNAGIGHDIIAILDGDAANPIILNDYYQTDLNTYTSGNILFQLKDLEEGLHTIRLKVWDVLNNSSEKEITFYVTPSNDIIIVDIKNYPNPLVSHTYFTFEHNQAVDYAKVRIDIYDIQGSWVRGFENIYNLDGFNAEPIEWDGTSKGGALLENGVYIYKLRITTPNGTTEKSERLLIMR